MNTYFALFLIATFSSLVITPLIRRFCERFELLDIPLDGRRVHSKGVPRLGGVAIYLSCVIALSALPFVDNMLTQALRQNTSQILIALIPATLVLLLGVYDDLRGTNATVKFIALGLLATLFYAMGGRIEGLSIPFVGSIHLPSTLSFLLTVFWLVGIANAFNLIDGMDGLASGAALFSSLVILLVSFGQAVPLMTVVALVLCGAFAGFLRYNFNPASIFLGDSGALFAGFTLAALSVLGSQKATTAVAVVIPILAFGLPVVDTGVTMARRLISGKPVFQGDNEHIHHMLLARGWSQRQVVFVLYGVCASFGLVAMLFPNTGSRANGFMLFVIAVVITLAVGRLRYHEVDELKAGVKRTVGDRRVRVANNIRVRRASQALSKATDLQHLFAAIEQMLEFGGFAYASVLVGRAGGAEVNEHVLRQRHERRLGKPGSPARGPQQRSAAGVANGLPGWGGSDLNDAELRNGRIFWSWSQDVEADEATGSGQFWCLRLPLGTANAEWGWINLYRRFDSEPLLVDMNYLSGLFRHELSLATERILEGAAQELVSENGLSLTASAGKITS